MSIRTDTERLDWLESKRGLDLRFNRSSWIREDGSKFFTNYDLMVDNTMWLSGETIRETVDLAMNMQEQKNGN